MTFHPPFADPWPWVIAVALPVIGAWLAQRSNRPLARLPRVFMTAVRTVALLAIALIMLNPGHWKQPQHEESKLWAVLLDRSASMAVPDVGNQTRWNLGRSVAQSLVNAGGDKAKALTFAAELEGDALADGVKPDGDQSAVVHGGLGLFNGAAGLGRKLAGVVIVSDGHQTREDPATELVLRAKAANVPIHVVPLGADWGGKDLIVRSARRLVMALPNKPVSVGALIENRGLGLVKPRVQVLDGTGKVMAEHDVELDSGSRKTVTLEVPTLPGGEYRVAVAPLAGEDITRNNEDRFRVQELTGRTRVFIAEGAPYWDSKFLAQLLREQGFMDVRAVYRLNAERYFRVDGTTSEPMQTSESTFPEKPEDFAKLDLIVLGKGAEGFLDADRIAALRSFVRDRGGALLLARGKPYAGKLAELEALEPVEWGGPVDGEFHFEPGAVGEAAGLFGQVLPDAKDAVWRQLPPLKDVERIARLKPFTQVLAMGTHPAAGREERIPLLAARHYGRGVVVALNADGLWKWDFYPQARQLGNMYEEFWTQLLQWTASYAEFMPGQELSLRLSEASIKLGRSARASIGWRGGQTEPKPLIRLWQGPRMTAEVVASAGETDAEGRRSWTALVQPTEAGTYRVQLINGDKPGPEAVLHVQAPPTEQESLAADAPFLKSLADDTGGNVWKPEQAGELAKLMFDTPPPVTTLAGTAEWEPLWPRHWVLCGIVGMLAGEWWMRRRRGLL